MQAVWWNGDDKQLSHRNDVTIPEVKSSTDVKVKVSYSGICGTDFHFMNEEMGKFTLKNGMIMGHEFSGTIVELGEEAAKTLTIGDRVAINPGDCCGACDWGAKGEPHFCENMAYIGLMNNGGWAQYCVVPAMKVYRLPASLSQMQGALTEPYSCVVRGWKRLEPFPDKDCKVLVQGADMNFGFDIVHPLDLNSQLAAKDIDSCGFKIVIDCTGNPTAVEKGIEIVARGAKILVFGCCPAGKKILVDPYEIHYKELSILGAFINPFCFGESIELMEKLAAAGYLDYEKLGIKVFTLEQYEEAIQSLKSGLATKATFQPEK